MGACVVVDRGTVVTRQDDPGDVPWWSFTKTVLAAAALTLVRDGRLSLDGILAGRDYSLRQLLQHRAGLRDYGALPAYHEAVARHDKAWPAATMLERARADRPLYRPGEGWAYSNIGYYFVRELIERATDMTLAQALGQLVLRPLGIEAVRLAIGHGELAADYDSGWVYHGSLIGPLSEAAQLLDRLLAGELLGRDLTAAMTERHPVDAVQDGRPWVAPGYGLGLMTGTVTGGALIAGHTGGGPESVVAVYHDLLGSRRTAAAHAKGADQGLVEQNCLAALI